MEGRLKLMNVYRQILRHCQVMRPRTDRAQAIAEMKAAFREGARVSDEEEIRKLRKKAEDRLSFLRISTPSIGRFRPLPPETNREGISKFTYVDGVAKVGQAVVKGRKHGMRQLDPADIQRHQDLVDRMNFRGKYWETGVYNQMKEEDMREYADYDATVPNWVREGTGIEEEEGEWDAIDMSEMGGFAGLQGVIGDQGSMGRPDEDHIYDIDTPDDEQQVW